MNENEQRASRTHANPISGEGARIGCQGCQKLVTASSGNACQDMDANGKLWWVLVTGNPAISQGALSAQG